jgi:hypothetical protein
VQWLVTARTQNRLAQPLDAEGQQQRADDEAERADRDVSESRPERRDDPRQHDRRRADAAEARAPAAYHADRKHDRQRLDRLDCAGQEGGDEEQENRAHGSGSARSRSTNVRFIAPW